MLMENQPFCCTMAVLGSFGEHGEDSFVSVEAIKRMIKRELRVVDLGGTERGGHKRCIIATSVDPINIRMLINAGFKVVDHFAGIQGLVHVLTYHQ